MKQNFKFTLALLLTALFLQACKKDEPIPIVNGAIQAPFSVSETKQVYFSQGNLQYQASTNTWRFAEHQYDYIEEDNENISSAYTGWIDLFGWGTSGWDSGAKAYMPTSTSTTDSDYHPGNSYTTNLTGDYAKADWGVYNAISNGGNTKGQWRTLTTEEWEFLLTTRSTSFRSLGTVNEECGLIILPDNWTLPSGLTYTATTDNDTTNVYTTAQWAEMESHGAVFLPAAGYRSGTTVDDAGSHGYYWSSSYYNTLYAYYLYFSSGYLSPANDYNLRDYGRAVRLVQDVK